MQKPAKDRRTVLVLDDDQVLRRSVRRILQLQGYDVIEADNAHEAFAILDEHPDPIDVVLCDLVLPGLGGREAANTILARRPDIRVLFTSGYWSYGSGRRELMSAGEPFLSKPFDIPELLSAVDALCASVGSRKGHGSQ